jgi:hypothetical protein
VAVVSSAAQLKVNVFGITIGTMCNKQMITQDMKTEKK